MSEESSENPKSQSQEELRILGGNSLSKPAGSGSRAINEMVDRSLAHIQTSKELSKLHRIGEHELCTPDYQLVCAWAEQSELDPEHVMHALTFDKKLAKAFGEKRSFYCTEIIAGKFRSINLNAGAMNFIETLNNQPVTRLRSSSFPNIIGLEIQRLDIEDCGLSSIDLNIVPKLKALRCSNNELTKLDLSPTPYLSVLECKQTKISELDLVCVPDLERLTCGGSSGLLFHGQSRCFSPLHVLDLRPVSKLTHLDCSASELTELDLRPLPLLGYLDCGGNKIETLDFSPSPELVTLYCDDMELTQIDLNSLTSLRDLNCQRNKLHKLELDSLPNLTELDCSDNQLDELDITPLNNLEDLIYDKDKTRLIQRPDQNF